MDTFQNVSEIEKRDSEKHKKFLVKKDHRNKRSVENM
jgi:hypothetical protein